MLKFLKYDFKSNLKTTLMVCLFVSLATVFSLLQFDELSSYVVSSNDMIRLVQTLVFIAMRFGIFALFIYFGNDFVRNITLAEKNLIFTSPIATYKFLLAKIFSVTLSCALAYGSIFATDKLTRLIFLSQKEGYVSLVGFKALLMIFSLCLVALVLQHSSILLTKGLIKKTKFKYVWLLPFTIIFALYIGGINLAIEKAIETNAFFDMFDSRALDLPSALLIGFNFLVAGGIFMFNSYQMDHKIDF